MEEFVKVPKVYFEIPVYDLSRAAAFYTQVFGFEFEKELVERNGIEQLSFQEENLGICGALAKGDMYRPNSNEVAFYYKTYDIDAVLSNVLKAGGTVILPKKIEDNLRYIVAEFGDCEGNRIALHQIYPSK